jgi:hypothetical protein
MHSLLAPHHPLLNPVVISNGVDGVIPVLHGRVEVTAAVDIIRTSTLTTRI